MLRSVALLFACLVSLSLGAQQITRLQDGDAVEMRGVLTMEPAGRLQFVTMRSDRAYLLVFKGEAGQMHDGEPLHEIGLAVPSSYAAVYAHRGERVTVAGTMHLDDVTPYFWHGTRMEVKSLRTASGEELALPPMPAVPVLAGRSYRVFALLPADLAAPWKYRYMGPNSLDIQSRDALHCSSNGAGDVVNCFCAEGYHATEAKATLHGVRMEGSLMDWAQFVAADDKGRQDFDLELMVACSR